MKIIIKREIMDVDNILSISKLGSQTINYQGYYGYNIKFKDQTSRNIFWYKFDKEKKEDFDAKYQELYKLFIGEQEKILEI